MIKKTTGHISLNHEKLFQSLASACIVVATDDPHFTILEENHAHEVAAMASRDNSIGRPLFEVFPDTSEKYTKTGINDVAESIRRVIKTGEPDTMPPIKYDLKDETGQLTPKYWDLTHHPVIDDGKVIAVYQATNDITEQVLGKQKLQLTQYQLNQAVSNSAIGMWVWDIVNGKVVGDSNIAEIFGLDIAEVQTGLPIEKFVSGVHPDDRKRLNDTITDAIEEQSKFECEYRTINKNGTVRWVIARGKVECDDQGQPTTFPGVVFDITERKNAENNLAFLTKASTIFSASLDYKKTLNTIATMVVPAIADWCTIELLDAQGQLQQVAVAHKDPQKVEWAKELREQQGPPDLSDYTTGTGKVIHTGEPEFYPTITDEMLVASAKSADELELLRGLGFTSAIIAPLKLNEQVIGTITFISSELLVHYTQSDVAIAQGLANRAAMAVDNANLYQNAQREIAERRLLQDQLEEINESLENHVKQRTKELETTNKGLKSEIAKRLKAEKILQTAGQELERRNQELQDFAYVASHDLQEPLRKIQAFGDLLETEYGSVIGDGDEYLKRMRSAASRMSVLIEDLLAFSRVSTKEAQKIDVDLNMILEDVVSDLETSIKANNGKVTMSALPTVYADNTHMRQLFQNLIGNALKFHRPDVPPEVNVTLQPTKSEDSMYEIHVSDNGIGFDEKYLDRIFSVFQRLHNRETYSGTGIGLAVCRKIVERYDGTINAKSKAGVGSTFVIKLPIEQKER